MRKRKIDDIYPSYILDLDFLSGIFNLKEKSNIIVSSLEDVPSQFRKLCETLDLNIKTGEVKDVTVITNKCIDSNIDPFTQINSDWSVFEKWNGSFYVYVSSQKDLANIKEYVTKLLTIHRNFYLSPFKICLVNSDSSNFLEIPNKNVFDGKNIFYIKENVWERVPISFKLNPPSQKEGENYYTIYQINPDESSSKAGTKIPAYRRSHLEYKLKKKYGQEVSGGVGQSVKAEVCIFSFPVMPYSLTANHYFYDRTDNWGSGGNIGAHSVYKEADDYMIRRSEKISCSSKWLYHDTLDKLKKWGMSGKEVKYIPNGNVPHEFPVNIKKFEKPTAIYVGGFLTKVEERDIRALAEFNPDWDILVFGLSPGISVWSTTTMPTNVHFRSFLPESQLFEIIKRCHVGLMSFKNTAWAKGMLPNKLFNYINACIPVLYSGLAKENIEDFSEVAFPLEENLDLNVFLEKTKSITTDTYKKNFRSFDQVTDELVEFFELDKYLKGQ